MACEHVPTERDCFLNRLTGSGQAITWVGPDFWKNLSHTYSQVFKMLFLFTKLGHFLRSFTEGHCQSIFDPGFDALDAKCWSSRCRYSIPVLDGSPCILGTPCCYSMQSIPIVNPGVDAPNVRCRFWYSIPLLDARFLCHYSILQLIITRRYPLMDGCQ